jgi:hypothetical protein
MFIYRKHERLWMSLSDPTTVDAGGHSVVIEGRPLHGDPVRVTVDGDGVTLPLTGDRKTVRKPHKYVAKYSNGASIVDKHHKQVITFPRGGKIVRKPNKTVIRFGDGTNVIDKPHKTTLGGGWF